MSKVTDVDEYRRYREHLAEAQRWAKVLTSLAEDADVGVRFRADLAAAAGEAARAHAACAEAAANAATYLTTRKLERTVRGVDGEAHSKAGHPFSVGAIIEDEEHGIGEIV